MRRRYRWCDEAKALVEVQTQASAQIAPFIQPDLPGYQSPVTGKWIEGRRARRDDLRRAGSRPYEGRKIEMEEANKYRIANERKLDQLAEKAAVDVWQHSPERIRRVFK